MKGENESTPIDNQTRSRCSKIKSQPLHIEHVSSKREK